MGPIQTAVGQLLGVAGGVAVASKKLKYENERQADKEQPAAQEANPYLEAEMEKEKERKSVSKSIMENAQTKHEVNKKMQDADSDIAKAIALAQKKKLASPRNVLFDESGRALATYRELATVLSRNEAQQVLQQKRKSKNAVKDRRAMLKDKVVMLNLKKNKTMQRD